MPNNLHTDELSVPLDGATTASVEINTSTGNLLVDGLPAETQSLASGTVQYFEKQGRPTESLTSEAGHASLTLKATDVGRPGFRLPWQACLGATDWQIHLNPRVASDITARTGGGNVQLNLAGVAVTGVCADSGGGNLDVVLPEYAANLRVIARTGGGNVTVDIGGEITGTTAIEARSGAGNVVVAVPRGVAARVKATTGLGRVTVEPQFSKVGANTYESADYQAAADKLEITVSSGAGNVAIHTRT